MAGLATAGALVVPGAMLVALLGGESTTLAVAATAALAAGALLAFLRQVRRPLIALLFFVAPLDISKAIVAPAGSIFYASGPFYSPGLYVTVGNAVLLALLAVWMVRRLLVERQAMPLTRLDAVAFAYGAWIWLRAIGTPQGDLSIASAASYSLSILGFYVVSHQLVRREDLRLALTASAIALALQLVDVAAQVVTQSPLTLPGSKGFVAGGMLELGSAQTMRPPGTFTHPNALAHYLVVVLTPLLALAFLGPTRLPRRVWLVCTALLGGGIAALLATLSRGGWAAFAIAAIVVVAVYRRQGLIGNRQIVRGLAAATVAAMVVVVVEPNVLLRLTTPDGRSLESRGLLAEAATVIIEANPWTGVGFGNYNREAFGVAAPSWALVSEDYHFALHQLVVHNHFLLVAAELGIPAMLAFVHLLWRFVRLPWPLAHVQDAGRTAVAVGLSAGMVGQVFFLNSDNYYADIRVFLLWLSAGVLQAMTLREDGSTRRPRTAGMSA